ncbi:MAG: hypothetical protein NXI22_06260 [bacterium]|nr:hypothetical protein [bacterium]
MKYLTSMLSAAVLLFGAVAQAQVVTSYLPPGSSPDDALWHTAQPNELPANRPSVRYFGESAAVQLSAAARPTIALRVTPTSDVPLTQISNSARLIPTLADPATEIRQTSATEPLPLTNIQNTAAPAYVARPLFPRVRGLIPANRTPTTSQAYVLPNTVYSGQAAVQAQPMTAVQPIAANTVGYDPCTCQPIVCRPTGATYTTAQAVLTPTATPVQPAAPQVYQAVPLQQAPAATLSPQLGQVIQPTTAAYPTTRQGFGPLIPLRRQIPEGTFLGQGILGQPAAFVEGQPVRNFVRYLTL